MSVNYTFKAFESDDTLDDDVGVVFPSSKYTKVSATFDDMVSWPPRQQLRQRLLDAS